MCTCISQEIFGRTEVKLKKILAEAVKFGGTLRICNQIVLQYRLYKRCLTNVINRVLKSQC